MNIEFDAEVTEWRGPAPFVFAVVPPDVVDLVHDLASELTYGWGVVPANVTVDDVRWTTSLVPEDRGYVVPSALRSVVSQPSTSGTTSTWF